MVAQSDESPQSIDAMLEELFDELERQGKVAVLLMAEKPPDNYPAGHQLQFRVSGNIPKDEADRLIVNYAGAVAKMIRESE